MRISTLGTGSDWLAQATGSAAGAHTLEPSGAKRRRYPTTLPLLLVALCVSGLVPRGTQAQSWPSLGAQIAASPVAIDSGSELAKLIAVNQDFGMLRPEEANDNRGLPPWLRVLWRKSHPQAKFPPLSQDPTGGYPLVLKEVWEWLLHHQDLQPGAVEADRVPGEAPWLEPEATASGEVRVSGPQTKPRSESDIRVNFLDPRKIIAASNSVEASGRQSMFYSTDSGKTWGQTKLSLVLGDQLQSDPAVEWTSDGTAWTRTLGISTQSGFVLRLRSYKSTDNGATWTFEATPSGSQNQVDKEMHWVDHGASSPCKDYQYAIWHNDEPAFVSVRNPITEVWSAPVQVSGAESTGTAIGGDVKANAFGDAFGFWPTTTNARVFGVKSTNCGTSWGTPVQIATTFDTFDIGVPSFNRRRALIYVAGGAYRTAGKNLVYATWTDLSGKAGCTTPANEPGASVASICKTRIWFSRSTNGGATWSAKRMVNDQASLNDQYNQWLAVDETTGQLGLMYYDTVADAGRKKAHVYFQSSFDDGVTWSAPLQVTSQTTDETTGGPDNGNQFGDYNSLSGIAGTFWPSWTDRRSGGREEIWTAKVTSNGANDPPPGPWLTTPALPGFQFKSRIDATRLATPVSDCVPETLCLAGAIPTRTEIFVRIIGPRPNGFLWPEVIRFTVSQVELWIQKIAGGPIQYYNLPGVSPNSDVLNGLVDREGFLP